jgi:hypothetical protein
MVEYGEMPTLEYVPTHTDNDEWQYSASTWDKSFEIATEPITYTEVIHRTKKSYTITFYDAKENTLSTQTVTYGEIPTIPEIPTHEDTAEWDYSESIWDTEPVAVTGAATYTEVIQRTKQEYLVTYNDFDGNLFTTETVAYGGMPTLADVPTHTDDYEWHYLASTWDRPFELVTAATTYTEVLHREKKSYLVTFKNYDDTILTE